MKRFARILLLLAFCTCATKAHAQKFIFRDLNQELLGLVASVASDYDVRSANFPIRYYDRYCELYDRLSAQVGDTPAVDILRGLLGGDGEIDQHEIKKLAIISREGFTGFNDGFVLPPYVADPSHELYGQVTALLENLRELYNYGPIREYFTTRYLEDYQEVVDGSGAIFEETEQVLEQVGSILSIPPPENYVNYFCLLSMPNQNFTSVLEKTDGTKVAYAVTGITFSRYDQVPEFDVSPELVFNIYGFSVIENARHLSPGYAGRLARLDTPAVHAIPMYDNYFDDIEEYMMGNAVPALTAYMFESIGNEEYGSFLVTAYGDMYLYLGQMLDLLRDRFAGSGQSFYDLFPGWFDALTPAQ